MHALRISTKKLTTFVEGERKHKKAYYQSIFMILLLTLIQIPLVFSNRALEGWDNDVQNGENGYLKNLVAIAKTVDIPTRLRGVGLSNAIIVLCITLLFLGVSTIYLLSQDKNEEGKGNKRGGNRFEKLSLKILGFILHNYDLFFFIILVGSVNFILCRDIQISRASEEPTSITAAGGLTEGFESLYDNLGNLIDVEKPKSLYITRSVMENSDQVKCYSLTHISLIAIALVTIGFSLLLKYMSEALLRILQDTNIYNSKNNILDLLFDLLLVSFFVTSRIMRFEELTLSQNYIRLSHGFKGLASLTLLLTNTYGRPFNNSSRHYLRAFQASFFAIIEIIMTIGYGSDFKGFFFLGFGISLLMKTSQVASTLQDIQIIGEMFNKREILGSKIIRLYLMSIEYFQDYLVITIKNQEHRRLNEICLHFESLLRSHVLVCRNIACYCRDGNIERLTNFSQFSSSFKNTTIIQTLFLIEEILCKAVASKVQNSIQVSTCYISHLINYMGQSWRASEVIKQVEDSFKRMRKKSPQSISLFKELIKKGSRINKKYGHLAMLNDLEFATNQSRSKQYMNLYSVFRFISRFEGLKLQIRKLEELRILFLKTITNEDSKKANRLFKLVASYSELQILVIERYRRLNKKAGIYFAPLQNLMAVFCTLSYQNDKFGYLLAKSYKKQVHLQNLNKIFFRGSYLEKRDPLAIRARFIDDDYRIEYSSRDSRRLLGYDTLEGVPLSMIIPEPISLQHSGIIDKHCGKILMKSKYRKLHCVNRQANIVPVEIAVRISYNTEKGVGYDSLLQFDIGYVDNCVAITDHLGTICASSQVFDHYFQKRLVGLKIFSILPLYDDDLVIINSLVISLNRNERSNISVEEILAKNPNLFLFIDLFSKTIKEKSCRKLIQTLQIQGFEVRMYSYYSDLIQDQFYYFYFSRKESLEENSFDFSSDFDLDEQSNSSAMCRGLDNKNMQPIGLIKERNEKKSLSILSPIKRMKLRRAKKTFGQVNKKKNNNKYGFGKLVKKEENAQSFGGSINRNQHQFKSLQFLVHERLDTGQIYKEPLILSVLIFVLVLINSLIFSENQKSQFNLIDKTKFLIPSSDVFSWGVWAQANIANYIDMCRFAREGIFQDDYGAEVGSEDSFFETCTDQIQVTNQYIYDIDQMIDRAFWDANLSINLQFVKKWNTEENNVLINSMEGDGTGAPEILRLNRSTSAKYIDSQISKIMERDYTDNDTIVTVYSENGTILPSLDQLEYELRESLNMDFSRFFFEINLMFNQYIINIPINNDRVQLFFLVLIMIFSILLLGLGVVCTILTKHNFDSICKMLFAIDVFIIANISHTN